MMITDDSFETEKDKRIAALEAELESIYNKFEGRQPKDWKWYQEQRNQALADKKQDPWADAKVQQQMLEDARILGDNFRTGDYDDEPYQAYPKHTRRYWG